MHLAIYPALTRFGVHRLCRLQLPYVCACLACRSIWTLDQDSSLRYGRRRAIEIFWTAAIGRFDRRAVERCDRFAGFISDFAHSGQTEVLARNCAIAALANHFYLTLLINFDVTRTRRHV